MFNEPDHDIGVHDPCFRSSTVLADTGIIFLLFQATGQLRGTRSRTVARFHLHNRPKEILLHHLPVSTSPWIPGSPFLELTGRDCPLNTPLLVLAINCGLNSSFCACQECLWPPCLRYTSCPSPSEFPAMGTHLSTRYPTASPLEQSAQPQIVIVKRFHRCSKSVMFKGQLK